MKQIVGAVSCAVLFLSIATPALCRDAESARRWHDDLSWFKREAPRRHPQLFHALSRGGFEAMVDDLDGRIGSLEDYQIVVGLARIVAAFGPRDGHSRINLLSPALHFHLLPLNFYSYADGLFIRAAAKPYADLAGARVVSIGGMPAEKALDAVLAMSPGDNAESRKSFGTEFVSISEVLRTLRIAAGAPSDPVPLAVVMPDGSARSVEITPVESRDGLEWTDVRDAHPAMYRRWATPDPFGRHGARKNFWFEYLPDTQILYVNFTVVGDSQEETVAKFFQRVFDFADRNPVKKFVLDIRNNSGGNNYLNEPVVAGLIKRDATIGQHGKLFVIIGRETFSAAQNLANRLLLHTDAIFVGEPTGGAPNHFGDSLPLILPNSRVEIRLASVWWQDLDPRDQSLWIAPEVAAEPHSSDDRDGRDPAMQAIATWRPETPLADRVRAALQAGGKAEATKVVTAWRAEPAHAFRTGLNELNVLAAQLYGEKRADDAVAVFEVNAAVNADAWLAQNSLGRAYAAGGRTDDARAAFERALKIRPDAPETLAAIDRLGATPR